MQENDIIVLKMAIDLIIVDKDRNLHAKQIIRQILEYADLKQKEILKKYKHLDMPFTTLDFNSTKEELLK